MKKLSIKKDNSKILIEEFNTGKLENSEELNLNNYLSLKRVNGKFGIELIGFDKTTNCNFRNDYLLSEIELNGQPPFATSDDLFTYFNANFGDVVQLTQGGNPLSPTNRLPVDVGGATFVIEGDVVVQNEVEIKNEDGNPIPTTNAELQTYLSENLGTKTDEKATNENDAVSLFSFIKGIFENLKEIFSKTPNLQDGNVPVFVNNQLREITVEEHHKGDGEGFNIPSNGKVTSFSIVADNPTASIENVNLGVTQSVSAISQDYNGAVLTTELKYRIIGSKGIVTINKLV